MVDAPESDALTQTWKPPKGIAALSAVNQGQIGKRYIATAFAFFLLGGLMALLMRTQLARPNNDFLNYELYNSLFTMHGTTMMFLFAVPILEGAAIMLLPPMLGARDMIFPRLTAFGYWSFLFGGLLLYSSFLFGMAPDGGWFMYTPLTTAEFSPGKEVDFWLIGITLVEAGNITAALEIATTILRSRAPGMSLSRMPLFAWYMLVVSFMILIGFPPLVLGDLILEIERSFNWPYFDPERGGHPLLWQHLFWIFGHPEVYVIFLPAAGFVSMMVATFAQRPTAGHSWLVVSVLGTGFASMALWVHHMFTTGIPLVSLSFFSAASMTVSIFSGIQVFSWIATLWLGRPVLKTPLLFVAGFIFLFVLGGLTGVMHAVIPFDWQTHSTYFLVAHFHYVLFGGMVFPLFGAIYYWFPLFTGKMMSEALGKWNFWLLFVGFNVAFFPMHISGLMGMPRRIYTYPDGVWEEENLISTIGAYMIAAGVLVFIVNFFRSIWSSATAGENPWNAGTLEWAVPLPIPPYNFRSIPHIQDRYPLWKQEDLSRKIEGSDFLVPRPERGARLGVISSTVTGKFEHIMILAKPDYTPLIAAIVLTIALVALLAKIYWVAAIGTGLFVVAVLVWAWRQPMASERERRVLTECIGKPVGADAPGAHGWWGTCMAVAGDAALFMSVVFAYFYLWTVARAWPPSGASAVDLTWPMIGIGLLVLGSVLMHFTSLAWKTVYPLAGGLVMTALVGIAFAGLQFWLLVGSGAVPAAHAYFAMIYTLIGFHLLHLGIAVLMLLFGIAWALFGPSGAQRSLVVQNTALVWHYVAIMGMITIAVVYFSPFLT